MQTYINTAADGTGGTLARDFTVRYISSANSTRSLVDSLQVCGEDGKCLPKTQMGWGSTPIKMVQKHRFVQNVNGDNEQTAMKSISGNFDGSGKTTVYYPVQGPPICTNCASQIPRALTGGLNGIQSGDGAIAYVDAQLTLPAGKNRFSEAISGDLDGNGRDDIVLIDIGTRKWAYCLSLGSTGPSAEFAPCQMGGTLPALHANAPRNGDIPSLVSLRNNGEAQLITLDNAKNLYICGLDNGAMSCSSNPTITPADVPTFDLMPVSLSKQGMTDFYTVTLGGTDGLMVCNYFNEQLVCKKKVDVLGGLEVVPADMNGDGLTDLYYGDTPVSAKKPTLIANSWASRPEQFLFLSPVLPTSSATASTASGWLTLTPR